MRRDHELAYRFWCAVIIGSFILGIAILACCLVPGPWRCLKTTASWLAGGALAVLILPPVILLPLVVLGAAVLVCGPALDDYPKE